MQSKPIKIYIRKREATYKKCQLTKTKTKKKHTNNTTLSNFIWELNNKPKHIKKRFIRKTV